MKRSDRFLDILKGLFPHRFLFARLTKLPLVGDVIDKIFFEEDYMMYLPKDEVIDLNIEAEKPDNIVLPSQVVEHFIKEADFRFKMDFCICRRSNGCEDYPIEYGCLFLGEAAKSIDPELGRELTEEEAIRYVKKTREAGLVHLIGRNKLDPVWLNVRPGEKLLTICNCCPCCCLWKMLVDLREDIGGKIHRMPGVKVEVLDSCTACGNCLDICFIDAITIEDGKAVISDECRGCGRCVEVCPNDAIEITIDDELYNRSVENIEGKIDLS